MTGTVADGIGSTWGTVAAVVAVEVTLAAVSVAYAAYLHHTRRAAGDLGVMQPVYTAVGTLFTAGAHLLLMLVLWPLDPGAVTALLLAQFVISGLPPLLFRDYERRNATATAHEAELDAVRQQARLDAIRDMNHD